MAEIRTESQAQAKVTTNRISDSRESHHKQRIRLLPLEHGERGGVLHVVCNAVASGFLAKNSHFLKRSTGNTVVANDDLREDDPSQPSCVGLSVEQGLFCCSEKLGKISLRNCEKQNCCWSNP